MRKFRNIDRICGYCGDRKTSIGHKTRGGKTWEYENWSRWKGVIACSRCYKTMYDAARPKLKKRQKLDGLERVCKICKSHVTRIVGTARCPPYPRWYVYGDGMICYRCKLRLLARDRARRNDIPERDFHDDRTLIDLIRKCPKYVKWRKEVVIRDNFRCYDCGASPERFHVHHMKSFLKIIKENGVETLEDGLKCEELWEESNGTTLCIPCHGKRDPRCRKKY
jgi:hypothetical protein